MPASSVVSYAVACLERDAIELSKQMDLFLTPAEAFAGKDKIRRGLADSVRRMLGLAKRNAISPEEQAAVAEIEREIAEQFPWAANETSLNQVWRDHGRFSGFAGGIPANISQLIGGSK
jgi:hypothetical protein